MFPDISFYRCNRFSLFCFFLLFAGCSTYSSTKLSNADISAERAFQTPSQYGDGVKFLEGEPKVGQTLNVNGNQYKIERRYFSASKRSCLQAAPLTSSQNVVVSLSILCQEPKTQQWYFAKKVLTEYRESQGAGEAK